MKTYLLAWNPRRWQWNNIVEMSNDVQSGKDVFDRWSSGVSKKPQRGDRFFLIRLGEEPRGIFASGQIEKGTFEDLHWDETKSSLGETTNYVTIRYDVLLNPDLDGILPRDLLNAPPLSEMHWDTQMSGVQIPDHIANELESLWSSFVKPTGFSFPEEVGRPESEIFEGAVKRVSVNAYERNPEARRKCIEHYGITCQVCGFNFEKMYGDAGKDFIHVHHLKQISEIGETYQIDPIQDLRPVCPNCHAIIHKRNPPYTLEEVKGLVRNATLPPISRIMNTMNTIHTFEIEGLAVQTGDVICTSNGKPDILPGEFWRLVGRLVPGDVDHVVMYVGPGGRCVEAGSRGVITFDMPDSKWNTERMARERGLLFDTFYGIASPLDGQGYSEEEESQMRMAVARYCLAQVGKPYNLNFLNAETEESFYCSQLIYKAYQQVGINLNTGLSIEQLPGTNNIVYPQEIWGECMHRLSRSGKQVAASDPSR